MGNQGEIMSFPPNDIADLLNVSDDILYNMGESTSLSYHVKDLCADPNQLAVSVLCVNSPSAPAHPP